MSSKDNHVIVSGGFDPIHLGHLNLINEASKFGKVIVIVNSDEFLLKKKGFYLIPSNERVEIIKNLKNVENVFLSIDKDESVSESIKTLATDKSFNIKFFANGGDRKKGGVPEDLLEQELGIRMVYSVGGEKTQSSSHLIHKSKIRGA